MTVFNPETFGRTPVTGANDTQRPFVEDGEYPLICDNYAFRQYPSKDGHGQTTWCDLLWSVDDPGVREKLNRDKVIVRQSFTIDLTPEGGLDMRKGRNDVLGRTREACGINRPGQEFSFEMFKGCAVLGRVTTRQDGETTYNDVRSVTKLR